MIHTVWRHSRQLRDPAALAQLLRGIPFLNGGLFECLDDRVQKGNTPYTVEVRIDGFATDLKKQPKLPNGLFYGVAHDADLSQAYGDSSRRNETVRPLLDAGHRVRLLVRSEAGAVESLRVRGVDPAAVELHLGDMTDAEAVAAAAHGCEATIHAAAAIGVTGRGASVHEVNTVGARTVVGAALDGAPLATYVVWKGSTRRTRSWVPPSSVLP